MRATKPQFFYLLLAASLSMHALPTAAQPDSAAATEEKPSTNGAASAPPSEATTPPEKTAAAPLSPGSPIDLEKQRAARLKDEVEQSELRWLNASGEQFMALWKPDTTGTPFGAVLILHGLGDTLNTPHTVRALRANLSLFGWATLSIGLPPLKPNQVPPRPHLAVAQVEPATENSEAATEQETETNSEEESEPAQESENTPASAEPAASDAAASPPRDVERISDERLQAALDFLEAQGQYNIAIIALGESAVRATRFIDTLTPAVQKDKPRPRLAGAPNQAGEQASGPIQALILVDARNSLMDHNSSNDEQKSGPSNRLDQYFNDPSLPVLDIYFGDHYLDRIQVQERKKMALEKGIKNYFQTRILPPTRSEQTTGENALTRRIRGFLNTHAKGVEVARSGKNIR